MKMVVLCDQLFPCNDLKLIPKQEHVYHCVGGQLSVSHSNVNMEIKFIAGYGTVDCVMS